MNEFMARTRSTASLFIDADIDVPRSPVTTLGTLGPRARAFPELSGAAEPAGKLTVGLLVDCELVRHGLQAMLSSIPAVKEVVICDALASHRCAGLDVLILSSSCLAARTGDAAEARTLASTKMLLLLDGSTKSDIDMAARATCDGFLLRNEITPQLLDDAISRMFSGDIPMPGAVASRLLAMASGSDRHSRAYPLHLTAREVQVLGHMTDGLSNKQIARRLQISPHGVKRIVASVLAKLDCGNRTLAVAVALRDGIISPARDPAINGHALREPSPRTSTAVNGYRVSGR